MKVRLVGVAFLVCFGFSFGQGLKGNVKLTGNTKVWATGHSVTLTWNSSPDADSYNVHRGTKDGGPYAKIKAGLTGTTFIDADVRCGQQLYYVVTATSGDSESTYSNQAVAIIP